MIELFPEGFEEVEQSAGVELAAYTDAAGEERLWHFFGAGHGADVEAGWEDRWRTFHQPIRTGRLWVGPPWEDAADRRARRRHRSRPRVRHRRAPDDAALPRAAAVDRAGLAARRRLRLRRALGRGGAARLRARARRRRRGAVDRGDARERASATASSSTRGSSAREDVLPPAATVVANISVDAVRAAAATDRRRGR